MARKQLLESDILRAMKHTKSNAGAARFLNVSLKTYRKYAKMYKDENGKDLYEIHKNQFGVGIPKVSLHRHGKKYILEDILAGKHPSYPVNKLKDRLFASGILEEKCEMCGFEERRITDNKIPVLLTFKDGDPSNYQLENLEVLCYNCYFLIVGNILGKPSTRSEQNMPG